jgi:CelD/BcsL family acetyltransferase involved in cellulose biosynthesis
VVAWGPQLDPQTRADWEHLLSLAPATPIFQYPEWIETTCLGAARPTYVLKIAYGAQPIGLLPLRRRGPLVWEVSNPLNQDSPPLVFDPVMERMACGGIADWIKRHRNVGMLHLGACDSAERLRHFRETARLYGLAVQVKTNATNMRVPLTAQWDDFLQRVGKSTRTKLRRIETHMLDNVPGITMEMVTAGDAVGTAVDDFIRLFRCRWGDQVGGSIFCNPHIAGCYREVVCWAAARGYAVLPVMRKAGCAIAVGIVFHLPGQEVAYFHHVARDTEALPQHWLNSPGTAIIAFVIRWAISRGAKYLDMGPGNAYYKQLLGGEPLEMSEITLARSPLTAAILPRLDRALYLAGRLPVHLRYHLGKRLTAIPRS